MYECPRIQEVFVFHNKRPVITEGVTKGLERCNPLGRPLLASVRPAACPFAVAPWVPDAQEALSVIFDGFDDRVCMCGIQTWMIQDYVERVRSWTRRGMLTVHCLRRGTISWITRILPGTMPEIVDGTSEQAIVIRSQEFVPPESIWV